MSRGVNITVNPTITVSPRFSIHNGTVRELGVPAPQARPAVPPEPELEPTAFEPETSELEPTAFAEVPLPAVQLETVSALAPTPPLQVEIVSVPAAPKPKILSRAVLTTAATILFMAAWHATGWSEADVAQWISRWLSQAVQAVGEMTSFVKEAL